MLTPDREYQRKHLRAPYKEPVLYVDQDFVFKAHALNISEGGLLLDKVPHFPDEGKQAPLLLSLPQYPYFKNFSLEKLLAFSEDIFPRKCVRLRCEVVRKSGTMSEVDQVFSTRIGAKFVEVDAHSKKLIKDYVDVFASNLIYLQVLIDNINSQPDGLEKVRALSRILNYDPEMKISQLRRDVGQDYLSLQWL